MVVVVSTLGCVDGEHEVVGSQPVSLCVSIAEDTGLEHLVVTVSNTCKDTMLISKMWCRTETVTEPSKQTALGTCNGTLKVTKQQWL